MNVMPLFPTPICYNEYDLDTSEIALLKKEKFCSGTYSEEYTVNDGLFTTDRNILLKYPNLSNIVHTHIKTSLYDANSLNIVSDIRYKILSSWVNKHPPKHSAHRHAHPNSMFTGVLYIDIPDNSGTFTFEIPMSSATWVTGTIQPRVNSHNIFNSKRWSLPVKNGVCILFPSHVEHYVSENKSNYDRYTIAFNVMLEGNFREDYFAQENLNIKIL